MKVVILGKLRSGKTTVANMVKKHVKDIYNIDLEFKPLGAPIYKEAEEFYKKHNLTWRKNRNLMQGIGEAFNDDYPNGDKIVELYKEHFDPNQDIVVEDCRRLTQVQFFKQYKDSIYIRVWADAETRENRCKAGEWSEGHITDTELDNFSVQYEINNIGISLQDLNDEVYEIVELFGVERKKDNG